MSDLSLWCEESEQVEELEQVEEEEEEEEEEDQWEEVEQTEATEERRFQGQAPGPTQVRAPWDPAVAGQRVITRLLQVEERYAPSALYTALAQRDPRQREELAKWALEVGTHAGAPPPPPPPPPPLLPDPGVSGETTGAGGEQH